MRIDKWLWAARFFKTRSLASKACELGRVHAGGQLVKPARDVKVGELLLVKTPGGDFELEVLGLSELRGPAPVAQMLYRETETGKAARLQMSEQRRALRMAETVSDFRPAKRDRRVLNRLRGRS